MPPLCRRVNLDTLCTCVGEGSVTLILAMELKFLLLTLHFTKTRNRGPDLRACNVPGQMGHVSSSQEGTKIHWGALTAPFLWGEDWMTLACLSLSCNSSICREDSIGCLFGGSYYYKTSAEHPPKKPKTQFVLIYIEKTSEYFYV